ncbi:DUF3089 domain-containing protein [Breoghania sp.]|uniref:DUF3089 domain-containing protein n=1 Tax=Breoghania sp. TaxID=2065378 RepID=UPI0026095EF9|nr:DUF3089 domain-containing protein [Breoghania sp.]MDJ0933245.1 DUF3089 domain-containing protein [Breoghania sp.]
MPDNPDQFAVDIFWVYPTVLLDDSAWLMNITDKKLIAAAQLSVVTEARAFSSQANLYAPLYRQMNIYGFTNDSEEWEPIADYGMDDVHRALAYYLKHYNKGRPFILAGHSQGSYDLIQIVLASWGKTKPPSKELSPDEQLIADAKDRLIAGYVVGWSLTRQDLRLNPEIKVCDEPHQTGCFVSYNSVAPGKQKESPVIFPGAIVVNPLIWTRDTALAPAKDNRGSTFINKDGTYQILPRFASAQIADFGLSVVAKDPERLEAPGFPEGVYHGYDYPLFYENIMSNASQRIQAYFKQKH